MNIHSIFDVLRPYFQRRRQQVFHRLIHLSEDDKILDVGGDHWFWASMDSKRRVTFLNVFIPEEDYDKNQFSYVIGDGRNLSYEDKEYDMVFSNSTIEHVGTFEQQQKFADEVRRAGKRYWVQTPNRWFFVEPHLVTPLFHYLPQDWQRRLMRYCTIWGLVTKPSKEQINEFLDSTRLLTRQEMTRLFPDASLYEEKFLFFTKSFVAYKTFSDNAVEQKVCDCTNHRRITEK
ncbi:MAG: class I SAM-dependent methyltransferase [Candidatus Omnitrophica bacterium]|nr:class I SAM-dependent methyltransferase [Candidatus Omnitrophota bacterium]